MVLILHLKIWHSVCSFIIYKMNFFLHIRTFLRTGVFAFLLLPFPLSAKSLKISDFAQFKETNRPLETAIYKKVFTPVNYFYLGTYATPLPNLVSSSLTTKYEAMNSIKNSKGTILRSILRSALYEAKGYLKAEFAEEPSVPSSSLGAAPVAILKHPPKSMNQIYPKLRFGSNFIIPGVLIENPMNMGVDLLTSFQTRDQILQSKISKSLSKQLIFSIENTNQLKQNPIDQKKYFLNLAYKF